MVVTATTMIAQELPSQIRQLVDEMGLSLEGRFSRCLNCNEVLQTVTKAEVADRLPLYVFQTQNQFSRCPQCQRIYWPGTHWTNMRAELRQMGQPNPDGPA